MPEAEEVIASTTEPDSEPPVPDWRPIAQRWSSPILLTTAALLAGIAARLGPHLSTLPVLAFATTAVALTAIDFAILRLPNALLWPTALAVLAACAAQAVADQRTDLLLTEAEGAAGVAAFYGLLHILSRGGLGLGDVKLGAVAGFVLASRDWQHVFDGTFLSYLVTLAIAIAMLARGRKVFPYGPGLLAGTIAVLLIS